VLDGPVRYDLLRTGFGNGNPAPGTKRRTRLTTGPAGRYSTARSVRTNRDHTRVVSHRVAPGGWRRRLTASHLYCTWV